MLLPSYIEARKRTKSTVEKEDYYIDSSFKEIGTGKKYYIKTYGCQMNEHDSENIKAILEELGFTESKSYYEADLVLLNTCSIQRKCS